MEETKIYFCGSIRGGRQDRLVYEELITYLQGFGRVLTEHIAFPDALTNFEAGSWFLGFFFFFFVCLAPDSLKLCSLPVS
jgi:hypothetical protein